MTERERAAFDALDEKTAEVVWLEKTTSTNDLVKQAAQRNKPQWYAAIADAQTAGRGRRGRSFASPDGTGVYLSVLLRPGEKRLEPGEITAKAAVAVCRALESVGCPDAGIKWINDVYVKNKKVCGILTEGAFAPDGNQLEYAVVGIGVNLFEPVGGFDESYGPAAGCVFGEAPSESVRVRFVCSLLRELKSAAGRGALDEYRAKSIVTGRRITVRAANEEYFAFAERIEDDYTLTVRLDDGSRRRLLSAEVSTFFT